MADDDAPDPARATERTRRALEEVARQALSSDKRDVRPPAIRPRREPKSFADD